MQKLLKATHIFSAKTLVYMLYLTISFNDMLTKDSFEQLGPDNKISTFLIFKAPIITVADKILTFFFIF